MYVACSRAQSEQGLRILLKGGVNEATNIVQRSLLDQEDKDEAVLAHERFQHSNMPNFLSVCKILTLHL